MSLPTHLNLADWPLLPEPRPHHPLLPDSCRTHYKEKEAALCQVDGMNDQESEEEGFGYDEEEEEEVGEEISTEGKEGGTGAGQNVGRVKGEGFGLD